MIPPGAASPCVKRRPLEFAYEPGKSWLLPGGPRPAGFSFVRNSTERRALPYALLVDIEIAADSTLLKLVSHTTKSWCAAVGST